MGEPDFVDELIARRTATNPDFPVLVDAARRRRELLRALAERREAQRRSQTAIAAAMDTSQSFIARLETSAADVKVSTLGRYAESLGYVVQYHLIPMDAKTLAEPAVVVH